MAAYAEQVLISTGRSDWKSKIEEEEEGVLVRELKTMLGRNGKFSDPYHNVMLTNSSFPPTTANTTTSDVAAAEAVVRASDPVAKPGGDPDIDASIAPARGPPASAFLLPSFTYVPLIPTDSSAIETFIKAFLLPSQLHQSHDRLTRAQKNVILRQPERQKSFIGARKVDEIMILICGHGGRDERCGKLGPILLAEFEDKLARQNVPVLKDEPVPEALEVNTEVEGYTPAARVGLISHIGGHKYAGNVIIYIPPGFHSNALAGKGIWYGRVEPQHVEGIVAKTVLDGKVIKEMFRGGIGHDREILRL
ncbi:hypothetical protein LTR28_003586 [Elasticomyces elasticus]|nr:hypothetical protein LTR28_003586 [Elasticomyces elasticus]